MTRGLTPLAGPETAGHGWRVFTSDPGEGWCVMGSKSDQVKGHAKEAAGILTGDKNLQSKGKAGRRSGEAEAKIDRAKGKVEEVIDKAEEKVEGVMEKAKDMLHRK